MGVPSGNDREVAAVLDVAVVPDLDGLFVAALSAVAPPVSARRGLADEEGHIHPAGRLDLDAHILHLGIAGHALDHSLPDRRFIDGGNDVNGDLAELSRRVEAAALLADRQQVVGLDINASTAASTPQDHKRHSGIHDEGEESARRHRKDVFPISLIYQAPPIFAAENLRRGTVRK